MHFEVAINGLDSTYWLDPLVVHSGDCKTQIEDKIQSHLDQTLYHGVGTTFQGYESGQTYNIWKDVIINGADTFWVLSFTDTTSVCSWYDLDSVVYTDPDDATD